MACGRTTLSPGTWEYLDGVALSGSGGQLAPTGQGGLQSPETNGGSGFGGTLATSGTSTLPTSGTSSIGDAGRAGATARSGAPSGGAQNGGTTSTAGEPAEAGSNSAGAGGEAGGPECPACLAGCENGACLPFAVSISQGSENICATVNHGPLKCWGDNFNGLLGNTYRIGPTPVPGLESGVRTVSVGTHAACALMDSGEVKCFGVGYGSVTKVADLPSDVASVACATPYFDHTCVASPNAGVICWGSNNFGQLGNGMTTPSFTYQFEHVNVIGLPAGATLLSAGSNDTCAITTGGALWCWGMNRYGQLGTGVFDMSTTAAPVVGFSSGAAAVAAGEEYTCALTTQGTVRCWGAWADGKQNIATPVDIAGVTDAKALSVGGSVGCAITRSGALKCWGTNGWNQLGTGVPGSSYLQAVDPVGMSSGVVAVAVGEYAICAVMQSGVIDCWGGGPGGGSHLPQPLQGF